MSAGYLGPLMTPGLASVQSLDDKFFYLSLAMVVTALVAASQWDVLAVDPRDAAILEPLPVKAGTIRRAKVSAIAILGGAVACARQFLSEPRLSVDAGVHLPADERIRAARPRDHACAGDRRRGGVRVSRGHRASRDPGGPARAARVHGGLAVGAGRADRAVGERGASDSRGVRSDWAAWLRRLARDVAADVVSRRLRNGGRRRDRRPAANRDAAPAGRDRSRHDRVVSRAAPGVSGDRASCGVAISVRSWSPRRPTCGTRGGSPRWRPRRRPRPGAAGGWAGGSPMPGWSAIRRHGRVSISRWRRCFAATTIA